MQLTVVFFSNVASVVQTTKKFGLHCYDIRKQRSWSGWAVQTDKKSGLHCYGFAGLGSAGFPLVQTDKKSGLHCYSVDRVEDVVHRLRPDSKEVGLSFLRRLSRLRRSSRPNSKEVGLTFLPEAKARRGFLLQVPIQKKLGLHFYCTGRGYLGREALSQFKRSWAYISTCITAPPPTNGDNGSQFKRSWAYISTRVRLRRHAGAAAVPIQKKLGLHFYGGHLGYVASLVVVPIQKKLGLHFYADPPELRLSLGCRPNSKEVGLTFLRCQIIQLSNHVLK